MTIEILRQLITAVVCGTLLGLHVGLRDRPGGVRTHIMTALGATLFCIAAQSVTKGTGATPLNVVQGVASGVGFIGGSVVLRRGATVQGLATGASLWIAAAIGCANGLGMSTVAIVSALFAALTGLIAYYVERALHTLSPLRERQEES